MPRSLSRLRPARRLGVLLAIASLAVVVPAATIAAPTFTDVPTSNKFYNDIEALVASGITSGCATNKYCPDGLVTRGQMAAFLNRLGALAPGKAPKVNADKLDGIDSTGFARSAKATIAATFANQDKILLTDSRTGAQVRLANSEGLVKVVNNGAAAIQLAGVGTAQGSGPESLFSVLEPGNSVSISSGALAPSYLDFTIVTVGTAAASTRISHVTCSVVPTKTGIQGTLTCIITG